ncbi:MAG: hypothetical protein ACYS1A_08855 [Planctomycetota bacterium]|jgi:hypothetical protein
MEIEGSLPPVTTVIEPPAPTEETPPPAPLSEPLPTEPPPVEEEELPGVIQNLLEGHYTGVSDVRLRINFADVLAAIEQEQIQAAAAEQIDNMLGAIGATIEGLLGTGDVTEMEEEPTAVTAEGLVEGTADEPPEEPAEGPTEEQSAAVLESQGVFVLAVDLSKQEFMISAAPSQDELFTGLNDAFDTFVTSLISVFEPPLAPPEPEPVEPPAETPPTEGTEGDIVPEGTGGEEGGTEPPAPSEPESVASPAETPPAEGAEGDVEPEEPGETEPPAESGFDYQSFIESLTNSFTAAIAELINAMDEVNILPELSEPNGNGGAYDKFVAIYNELQNPATGDDGGVVEEPLDAVL